MSGGYRFLATEAKSILARVIFAALAIPPAGTSAQEIWHLQLVDPDSVAGGYKPAIALDNFGRPHIAYIEQIAVGSDYRVRYAFKDGPSFTTVTLDTTRIGAGGQGRMVDVGVDSCGVVHVVYVDPSNIPNSVVHAFKVDSDWTRETVPDTLTIGKMDVSLALDGSNPRVTYAGGVPGSGSWLMYAMKDGEVWTIEAAIPGCHNTTLALDSSGKPHVLFNEWSAGPTGDDWFYATKPDTQWVWEHLDGNSEVRPASLALDANNQPHVCYVKDEGVRYASKPGSTWEFLPPLDNGVGAVSMALDSFGNPHAAYSRHEGFPVTYELNYATKPDMVWVIEDSVDAVHEPFVVALALDLRQPPSIARHVVYTTVGAELWYATTLDITVPVEVADLAASATGKSVILTWSLSREAQREVIGVHVQRAPLAEGPFAGRTDSALGPAGSMSFEDSEVEPGLTYWYRLALLYRDGSKVAARSIIVTVPDEAEWRTELSLSAVAISGGPVEVRYRIARPNTLVRLQIYDVGGRLVRVLDQGNRNAGEYVHPWDRRDSSGGRAARGIYLVQLRANRASVSKKLVLVTR